MKLWHGVVTGVIAYVIFVVAGAPASKLLPLLQPALPGVHFSGVDGTIWSGTAAAVQAPPVQLQQVSWRFRPFALLLGRAEVSIDGQLRGRQLQGRAGRALFGQPYLAQVRGSVAAQDALSWMRINQVGLDGVFSFNLGDVEWSDALWPAVNGIVNWSPANVTRPVALALGKAQLDARIEDGVTRGKLEASEGALLVQGDVELQPAGNYRLKAQLQQKGDVPP